MILFLVLACGPSAPPPPPDTPIIRPSTPIPTVPRAAPIASTRVDLTGLWAEIVLPVEGAEVVSGGDMVILHWPGTARSHHDAFANALVSGGFTLKQDLSSPDQAVELYVRGARSVMLSLSDDTVTLQDFGGDPAP